MRYPMFKLPILHRFDHESFRRRLSKHLRRCAIAYLLLIVTAATFQAHFALGLNASPSLPHRFFLIHKGESPQRGQYVAFRWHGGSPYPAGTTFVKVIAGMAGDAVKREDRDYFVNGTFVGKAKTLSRQGVPLEQGPTGVLPVGRYYVQAPHPDSLDSRYRLTGWITDTQIIGRAYALF